MARGQGGYLKDKKVTMWELIGSFRESIFFADVVWQRFGALQAPIEARRLVELSLDEFEARLREFLRKFTMIEPRTYEDILANNKTREIRDRLSEVFKEGALPEDCYEGLRGLRKAGAFFASSILTLAFQNQFIVYSDGVIKGIQLMFPWLAERIPRVTDYASYQEFQNLCTATMKCFGFESLSELHELFWHGQDTEWSFE